MKLFVMLIFFVIIYNCAAENQCNSELVQSICNFSLKIQNISQYNTENDLLQDNDSLDIFFDSLSSLLLKEEFIKMKNPCFKSLSDSVGYIITYSRDSNIKVFNFVINDLQAIPTYSAFLYASNCRPMIISRILNTEKDFGLNVVCDSIINYNKYILILASNKCGSICINHTASIYRIDSNKITKCNKIFFDGNEYKDDIEFDYLINEDAKEDFTFQLNKNEIEFPVFNESRTKKVGSKKYFVNW